MFRVWHLPCVLASFLAAGCASGHNGVGEEEAQAPLWFVDAARELGVDVRQDPGPQDGKYFMPQIVGTGVGLFDMDGDGLLDVLILQGGGPGGRKASLFKQLSDGKFKDVSAGSGLEISGHSQGVAVGDFDDDGLPDLAVALYNGVRLFRNLGAGRFVDVTEKAGLPKSLPFWATSLTFVDYDRDGRLDLFVTTYVAYDPSWPCFNPDGTRDFCGPKTFRGTVSKLYRNVGGGKFEDTSRAAGIEAKSGPGLGVAAADFTGDGWPDIFVANDGAANHLWVNQRDGTFKEEAFARGLAVNAMGQAEANMGIGWGDVDGDGLQDVFVTHLAHETNTLWKQGPPGTFTDWTTASRMHRPAWRATGFGTVLGDFDNDGHLDAAVVNGGVIQGKAGPGTKLDPFWARYGQRNQLFANDGTGRFKDVSAGSPALCGEGNVGRALAVGDLRNDGRLWLVVSSVSSRVQLLRNVASGGGWLGVRAYDPVRKRDALGAEIRVRAGGREWVRTAFAGGSFLSSNDPRAHFGLGAADGVEWVEVRWPDGDLGRERFRPDGMNRHVKLVRGQGTRVH